MGSKISGYQLFTITFIFQLGTTIIFGFGGPAGRDAWLASLISIGLGLLVVGMFTTLRYLNPGLTFVEWFPTLLGRWLGTPIAFLYPLLQVYLLGRGFADMRDLVSTAILQGTPLFVITGVFAVIIAYCCYGGIEIAARMGEIIFPVVVLMFLIETVLLMGSGVLHPHHIQPILDNGWQPIWNAVFPNGITQGYGESLALAMFWPHVKDQGNITKITLLATCLSGIMITCFDILAILVFSDLYSRFLYPLYTLLGVISVGNFVENLQMFGVLYFFATALLKCLLILLAALHGFQKLTGMKNYRPLIIPTVLIAFILGLTMSQNITEHIYFHHFHILVPYIYIPMFLVLPAFLLVIAGVRSLLRKK
ncbi:GerAB/ArcD/ProY family transporter [Paenibacillus barengoltzii]|jgi:spore germination protein KB|uniref:GerAB/ArcD/ProY family transporter n=1 Tax=Paenibacillus barengoltzii TaxID=343517 RepID=UPI000A08F5A5|nr:endospore germination permease [Paenibacillus barengoltzii]SMF22468.1 spore germination protein KB [Paenibacillus barengoltzii]